MTELKPCPFCGGDPCFIEGPGYYSVFCDLCEFHPESGPYAEKENAIQAWNTRKHQFAHFANDECWIYQGDGEDHLESLTCPVVISPEKLMEILATWPAPDVKKPVCKICNGTGETWNGQKERVGGWAGENRKVMVPCKCQDKTPDVDALAREYAEKVPHCYDLKDFPFPVYHHETEKVVDLLKQFAAELMGGSEDE